LFGEAFGDGDNSRIDPEDGILTRRHKRLELGTEAGCGMDAWDTGTFEIERIPSEDEADLILFVLRKESLELLRPMVKIDRRHKPMLGTEQIRKEPCHLDGRRRLRRLGCRIAKNIESAHAIIVGKMN
jgi:hypothetical protein